MQNYPLLAGNDQDRVQNYQISLLRHVVGDPLRVVGDPLRFVGFQLCVVGDPLVWFLKKPITWVNEDLLK